MNEIRFVVDSDRAVAAFQRAKTVMVGHLQGGLEQGAGYVAQTARRLAAHSDVTAIMSKSIQPEQVGELEWEVKPGVGYARYVEEGTGTFAGRARYKPQPETLFEYLRDHPGYRRFDWKGKDQRGGQETELLWRAKAWSWAIYVRGGTKPHPFMAPAAEQSDARVRQILRMSVEAGIREVFGGG